MFNKKIKKLISFFILVGLFLTGCTTTQTLQSSQQIFIKDILEFLTSEECSGRLPGTEGNRKAEEYIKDIFQNLGLEHYKDSYFFQYNHIGWKTKKEDYKMIIKLTDGEILQCKYGEDFLENDLINIDFKGKLTLDYKDKDIENKFILLEERSDILELEKEPKGAIFPMESFRRGAPRLYTGGMSMVQISPQVYNKIKDKGVEEIEIKFEVEVVEEEFPQNNIVGIIPGNNRKNAIVITAHFDHVGNNGDMIWKGAIDNGTGVSVLLNAAERLKKHSEKEKFEQDIVFCAFNGEDSGFQGSIPFVKDIKMMYENIYNINIDSVGVKGGGKLLIDGEDDSPLIKRISAHLREYDSDISTDKELIKGSSDHMEFINNGISAIGLSQEGCEDIIHTLEDDVDKVDIEYLEKLAHSVAEFIINNSEETFLPIGDNTSAMYEWESDRISEERNKLNLNEYKYIEIDGKEKLIRKDTDFFYGSVFPDISIYKGRRIEDFYSLYPSFLFPEKLGEHKLILLSASDNSEDYVSNPKLDEVYRIESKIENIEMLNLIYGLDPKDRMDKWFSEGIGIVLIMEEENQSESNITHYSYYQDNDIDSKEVAIGDEIYYPIYRNSDNKLNGLYKNVKGNGKVYHIILTVPYIANDDWPYETIDKTIEAYNKLNIKDFLEDVLNTLKDND